MRPTFRRVWRVHGSLRSGNSLCVPEANYSLITPHPDTRLPKKQSPYRRVDAASLGPSNVTTSGNGEWQGNKCVLFTICSRCCAGSYLIIRQQSLSKPPAPSTALDSRGKHCRSRMRKHRPLRSATLSVPMHCSGRTMALTDSRVHGQPTPTSSQGRYIAQQLVTWRNKNLRPVALRR